MPIVDKAGFHGETIMTSRLSRYVETAVGGERVRAFVPPPLPPVPPLDLEPLLSRLSAADRAIGRLDGITLLLPDHALFLYMYVRKEAVLSSQIEGTQSTLTDLLRFEIDHMAEPPIDDVREVSNYVDALLYGLVERLDSLPLSLRLIRELHERLLQSGRGERCGQKDPGNASAPPRIGSAAHVRGTRCSCRRPFRTCRPPLATSKALSTRTRPLYRH